MLKGRAKKDYQREYMRGWQRKKRGSKQGLNTDVQPNALHPPELDGIYRGNYGGRDYEPEYVDADGNPVYE